VKRNLLDLRLPKKRRRAIVIKPARFSRQRLLSALLVWLLKRQGRNEVERVAAIHEHGTTNVASYPAWQAWLREHKPPTLVVWGRNDPSFIAAGAEAFRRDLPDAEIHLLNAGHFALDEKSDDIARLILTFLAKHSF
jgi:pimeloyl-ACP methyl ester carboxylesterase